MFQNADVLEVCLGQRDVQRREATLPGGARKGAEEEGAGAESQEWCASRRVGRATAWLCPLEADRREERR